MIYMIYASGTSGDLVELTSRLRDHVPVKMAPVGYQIGSLVWYAAVKRDIEACRLAVVVLTPEAVQDDTVDGRIGMASRLHMPLITVIWEYIDPEAIPAQLRDRHPMSLESYGLDEIVRRIIDRVPPSPLEDTMPPPLVFISYSRTDRPQAVKLAHDLRLAGVHTWRDEEDIPAGRSWEREIEKALTACTHVILIATSDSVDSDNVRNEISFALNRGKIVIPVILETCDLPLSVQRAQWVDFRGEYEPALEKLVQQLGVTIED